MNEIAKSRKERLRACERALAEHMEEFVKVGLALKEIRDDKLYREDGYETFENYCKGKWEMTDRNARYLIDAADLRMKLPDVPIPETDESETGNGISGGWTAYSVNVLNRLGSSSKAKAVAERVVKEVKEKKAAGEKVRLGSVVRKHVEKELGVKKKPAPPPLPDFAEVVSKWVGQVEAMADTVEKLAAEDDGDALKLFARHQSKLAKDLAEAIDRLSKAWQVARTPTDRNARVKEA